jgi:plastocyanin
MYVRSSVLLLLLVVAAACTQPGSSPTSPAGAGGTLSAGGPTPVLAATVRFGNDSVGSTFPPGPIPHDQSGHAKDNLIPRTVVIDKGGTVTFKMGGGVHQVGIYKPGTNPEDVVRTGAVHKAGCPTPPPAVYITGAGDPNFIAVTGQPLCAGGAPEQKYTFTTPGRYLVICTFIPHLNIGMYGWVEVRER